MLKYRNIAKPTRICACGTDHEAAAIGLDFVMKIMDRASGCPVTLAAILDVIMTHSPTALAATIEGAAPEMPDDAVRETLERLYTIGERCSTTGLFGVSEHNSKFAKYLKEHGARDSTVSYVTEGTPIEEVVKLGVDTKIVGSVVMDEPAATDPMEVIEQMKKADAKIESNGSVTKH